MANDFLTTYTPLANDIAQQTGLDPSIVLGIIDTETGGGAHIHRNNLFGISPPGGVAGYPDVQTAAQAFVSLMQTPRYAAAGTISDPAGQAQALVRGGYNTVNPNYATIITAKAANFAKVLGYQQTQQDDAASPQSSSPLPVPPVPPAAAPSPTPAPAPASSADPTKSAVDQELNAPPAPTAKPTTAAPDPTKSAISTELGNPPTPASSTAPPAKQPIDFAARQPGPAPDLDETGLPLPQPGGPGQAQQSIIQAAKEGWQSLPSFFTSPEAERKVYNIPLVGPELAAAGHVVAGALGAAGALFRGGQETVRQAINPLNPQLARDIAALPEAFPLAGVELGGGALRPAPPASLAAARAKLGTPVTVSDLTGAIARSDRAAAADALTPPGAATDAASPLNPDAAARAAAAPPASPEDAAPPTAAKPTFLDGNWLRDAGRVADGMYDSGKGADVLTGEVRGALDRGDTVELVADMGRKTVPITGINKSGMMTDAKGQAWGTLPIAHDGTGTEGIRITPSAETRAADDTGGVADEAPRAAGAAGTPPGSIPTPSNAERAQRLRLDINQPAIERVGPNLRDDTAYVTDVPGGTLPPRMLPERDFSPQVALDHKARYGTGSAEGLAYRAAYDANTRERNTGMVDLLREDAGDANTLEQARRVQRSAAPDTFGAFTGETPVDASSLVDHINNVLDSREGKRDAVVRTMNNVRENLYDRNGNLETSPSKLYGTMQNIDDLLDKARRPTDREGSDAAVSRFALRDLRNAVANKIQEGAPRFQAYRQAYADRSQAVNQQRFLQRYQEGPKKITDSAGNLVMKKVETMLEDIHTGLKSDKFDLAQSLTDKQIQNAVNVRNELAAKKLSNDQAAVRGSDSYQQFSRAAEKGDSKLGMALKGAAELSAHGALGYLATRGFWPAGAVNALMAYDRLAVRPYRQARKAAKAKDTANALAAARDAELLSQSPLNPP